MSIEFNLNEGLTQEQLDLKLSYINTLNELAYQETSFGPSYIPKSVNLNGFIGLVKEAIDIDQGDKESKIILMDDFAKTNIFENPEAPGIDAVGSVSYELSSRTPGTTAGTNQPQDPRRREVVPQLRSVSYGRLENPKEIIFTFGQWFDNIICFKVNARSNVEANEFAEWFENIMEQNRQFFAYNGIMKYYFQERKEDAVVKEGDSVVYVRPMFYWVRTEKCYEITEQAINRIVVNITTT